MTKENEEQPKVKNFEVEQIITDHQVHKRHAFTFTVEGDEFKGHFHVHIKKVTRNFWLTL